MKKEINTENYKNALKNDKDIKIECNDKEILATIGKNLIRDLTETINVGRNKSYNPKFICVHIMDIINDFDVNVIIEDK